MEKNMISEQVELIKSLPSKFASFGAPVQNIELEKLEEELRIKLPKDFKDFYSMINGFSFMGAMVYPLLARESNELKEDLKRIYSREHEEVVNPMPKFYFPFSPNGRGDHYCLDLSKTKDNSEVCPIVFWQWDYTFFHPNDIEVTHNSFTFWLQELLEDLMDEIDL